MRTYDPVEEAKRLLDELVITKAYLEKVISELDKLEKISEDNAMIFEELYEKEFELAITLHGIHGDIHRLVDRKLTEHNEFQLKRVAQEADKIFDPLVIVVDDGF